MRKVLREREREREREKERDKYIAANADDVEEDG